MRNWLALSVILFALPVARAQQATPGEGLTELTLEQANAAYNSIAALQGIPFDYPEGCEAKAQLTAMTLEKAGILSGKAFLEGTIYFDSEYPSNSANWSFHVAPYVMVREADGVKPYVIDPFYAKTLVTYEDWVSRVSSAPGTVIKKKYFTPRFTYSLDEVPLHPTQYDPKLIADMANVFKNDNDAIAFYRRHHGT